MTNQIVKNARKQFVCVFYNPLLLLITEPQKSRFFYAPSVAHFDNKIRRTTGNSAGHIYFGTK